MTISSVMTYYVYILSNKNRTVFYTGQTNNLERRVFQHKTKFFRGFSSMYNCDQLMWYEEHASRNEAMAREKQVKHYSRELKFKMIDEFNPEWIDMARDWYDKEEFELYRKFDG